MTKRSLEFSKTNGAEIGREASIRVLHVDDDACFLKTAKAILEMQGAFQVDTVTSVEEAVDKMKKEEYDVVVSDYQMPEKDGLEFLRGLRQSGNDVPFIIFTGKGREEVVISALNLGANHYLSKNGSPEAVYSELAHEIMNAAGTSRAEETMLIQREELQTIFDSIPMQAWYKDKDNRLVRVNKAFAEYMGVPKKDLEGKLLCDLFPSDIAQKCWEEDKEVIATGQPKTNILDRHESAQGVRWFSTCKVPCRGRNGNIIGTINFSIDITENKKIEDRSKESEKKYRQLVENIYEGIWAIDKDAYTTFVNSRMAEMLGYSREEMIGKHLFSFMDKRGAEICRRYLERRQQGIKEQHDFEFLGKDGKRIYAALGVSPLTDDSGNYFGAIAGVLDDTERKRTEQEIASLARFPSENPNPVLRITKDGIILYANAAAKSLPGELKAEIDHPAPHFLQESIAATLDLGFKKEIEVKQGDRTFLFILSLVTDAAYANVYGLDITERKKALEKLNVVGKLTRHDIKNKHSIVLNSIYLARKALSNDHEALAYLQEIESACEQITKILDFAATYEKLGVEELFLVDVGKAVEEAVTLISDLRDVKVVNECQGVMVVADSLLMQLFNNMIDNSLKHGEKVSQIRIYCEQENDGLRVLYEDDGVGIPKANKQKIFSEGFTTGKGSGYGLYLVKRMVEVYDWTIKEEGEPNKGAKFIITIPARADNGYHR